MGNVGLVAIRITSLIVDRTEHRRRVIDIHERTWAVVNGFARNGHVISIHDPVNEPDLHPLGDKGSLSLAHCGKERQVWSRTPVQLWEMPVDSIIGQHSYGFHI